MAKALFITTDDVKKKSILKGNMDVDNFIQYIEIAQDTHIQNFLGTDLHDRIAADIIANTLTGDYLDLVKNHIKPMLIHWSVVEALPFITYTADNKGITRRTSENSETINKGEIDFLIEKARTIASHYTDRFIAFICENEALFPEYTSNTDSDVKPSIDTNFTGWVL